MAADSWAPSTWWPAIRRTRSGVRRTGLAWRISCRSRSRTWSSTSTMRGSGIRRTCRRSTWPAFPARRCGTRAPPRPPSATRTSCSSRERALDAVAPYADVTVDGTARIAGRAAYQLVLTPTSTLTLVGRIAVAIDAETRLPLRVQVFPRRERRRGDRGGVHRRVVRPDRPVDVRVHAASRHHGAPGGGRHRGRPASRGRRGDAARVRAARVRRGFDLRVALRLDAPLPAEAQALLPYAGPLLSAITVERDGQAWLLVGPVSVATLEQDAASLP